MPRSASIQACSKRIVPLSPFLVLLVSVFVLTACCVAPDSAPTGRPTTDYTSLKNLSFAGSWKQMCAHAEWSPRIGYSTVALQDGTIVLMGGIGGDERNFVYYNETWRSADAGKTWTLVNASPGWDARASHTSVVLPDGSIVLMGGSGKEGMKNDSWLSADKGTTWTCMSAGGGWAPRSQHTSVALPDGSIVIMAGTGTNTLLNDTWRSIDRGVTWTLVNAGAGWNKRFMHDSVAASDGSIILAGGYDYARYYNDVWRSTDNGATWTLVNGSAGWVPRIGHNLVAIPDGSIIVIGGADTKEHYDGLTDMWRSTDSGSTWSAVNTSTNWPRRLNQKSIVLPDGSIILVGGMTWTDVWRFQPGEVPEMKPSQSGKITALGTGMVHTLDPGDSIQERIDNANAGDTIILNPGTYFQHDIIIEKDTIIRANISAGGNTGNTIIDATHSGRFFDNSADHSLTIDNLSLRNGRTGRLGGAILSNGTLTITSTTFSNCSANYGGGAIVSSFGNLTIASSKFSNCSSDESGGGAIATYISPVTISSTTFSGCSAYFGGGAISSSKGSLTIDSSTFSRCSDVAGGGGAINAHETPVSITSSTFTDCSSKSSAGAIFVSKGNVTIQSSVISGCSAPMGGALLVEKNLNLADSRITDCTAVRDGGGAIWASYRSTVTMSSSTIANCSASQSGGAIYMDYYESGSRVAIKKSSTIVNCSAPGGGAIFTKGGGNITLAGSSTITGCKASEGGAIFAHTIDGIGNMITIDGSSRIISCEARDRGGAIFAFTGNTISVENPASITNCTAGDGNAIVSNGGPTPTPRITRYPGILPTTV